MPNPRPAGPPGPSPYLSVPTAPQAPYGSGSWPPVGSADQLVAPSGAPIAAEPRPRRAWTKVLAVAAVALLIGVAAGVGATYFATTPSRDRVRDQRDAAQTQADDAHAQLTKAQEDLAVAQAQVAGAKAITESCKRLVNDSKDLVDQWAKITAIFEDPANQDVVAGSERDAELARQFDTIATAIDHDRGLIEVDLDICVTTATTT